jgi:hypothetical protein
MRSVSIPPICADSYKFGERSSRNQPPPPEEGEQDRERHGLGADAEADERLPGADAPGQGMKIVAITASCFITALRRFETVESTAPASFAAAAVAGVPRS